MYENFAKPLTQFCEDNLHSYIVQPANAWSNLAYVFLGIGLYFLFRRRHHALTNYFAPIAILIGLFSFAYHASYTFAGEFLDLSSMFLLSSYLVVLNLSRLHKKFLAGGRNKFLLFLAFAGTSMYLTYFVRTIGDIATGDLIFILQILAFLGLEWKLHRKHKPSYSIHYLLIALGIFLLAFAIWLLDFFKIWCDKNSFHMVNGHAVWHIMTGVSILFLYLFYRQFDKAERANNR